MSDDPKSGGWRAAPRWLKIVAAISLAVNFTVAGLALGVAGKLKDWRDASGGAYTIRHVLAAMPEDRREAARARITEARKTLRRARDARREARREVIAATGAEEFDPAKLSAAFARLREHDMELRALTQSLMVEMLSSLTDRERMALAERLRQARYGRKPDRGAGSEPTR